MNTLTLMAIDLQPSGSRAAPHQLGLALPSVRGGAIAGNARLAAATGIVLLLGLAVIGVTLLNLRGLLSEHLFVGLVLPSSARGCTPRCSTAVERA